MPNPNLFEFNFLAQFAPYQLHRFAMDLERQGKPQSIRLWEKTEPRSLRGVLDGYAYVIPMIREGKKINLNDILNIHKACLSNVALNKNITTPGTLRIGHINGFGITRYTCTLDGLKELVEEHEKYPCRMPYLSTIAGSNECKIAYLKEALERYGYFEVHGDDGGLTDLELVEFYNLISLKKVNERYLEIVDKFQRNLVHKIEQILDMLYAELEDSYSSKKNQLRAIVKYVQLLERLHPFPDGNCRVFCMVFLNALLMQYGFPPTLISDPNKFDGYSIKELVSLVKTGFKETSTLIQYVLKEKSNPTLFNPVIRHNLSSIMDDVMDNAFDDEDFLPPYNHWCDVHPIQRVELTKFANKLWLALFISHNVLDISLQHGANAHQALPNGMTAAANENIYELVKKYNINEKSIGKIIEIVSRKLSVAEIHKNELQQEDVANEELLHYDKRIKELEYFLKLAQEMQETIATSFSSKDVSLKDIIENRLTSTRQTNKQIHDSLKRNGVFNHSEQLRKESFRNAVEQSREDYRSYAKTLLR